MIGEVRSIRNTSDADTQMVGDESADVDGGKAGFDYRSLLT